MTKKRFFGLLFLILAGVFISLPGYAAESTEFVVYFEQYAATPDMNSTQTMDKIRDFAKANPDMLLLLEGYSDSADVRKGVKDPEPVMDDLAQGRAQFLAHWLKTALKKGDIHETIRSYTGKQPGTAEAGHNTSSDVNRRVVATFYTQDSPPPTLAKEQASGKAPKILIEESVYHFSGIYEGEKVEHDFVVKNTGNETLDIKSVKPG